MKRRVDYNMNLSDVSDNIEMAGEKFNKYFGMYGRQFKSFMDPLLTGLTHKFEIDIIKFDGWLHQQGYSEKIHGSAHDYVRETYGKEAVDFIESLLKDKISRVKRIIKRRKKEKNN